MSVSRSLRRRGATALALAVTLAAGTLAAAPAQATDEGVYKTPGSATVYQHKHTASGSTTTPITWDQWRALGYPAPRPAPMAYLKYTWSPDIWAAATFDQNWLWQKLSADQWGHHGWPQPVTAGWLPGTEYFQFMGTPEIFAEYNGRAHELSYDEWQAAGFPQPAQTDLEVFKLTWTPEIAAIGIVDNELAAGVLTFEDWQDLGFPQPLTMPMLPGDVLCATPDSADLHYWGLTFEGVLSYDQWALAGFPTPSSATSEECAPA